MRLLLSMFLPGIVSAAWETRTCSEGDGFIGCDDALCYFDTFESCRVLCTEGCASSKFLDSMVECRGGVGCRNAELQRSRAICQQCQQATFYFSAVTCESSAACSGVNWASGNCCDGVGCPSAVPSCQENLVALCSSRVLDFTVASGGNPACQNLEEKTEEPTPSPTTVQIPLTPQPVVAGPTQKPTLHPTARPTASPTYALRLVQGTQTGIRLLLRGVQMPSAGDILLFEATMGEWFDQFYYTNQDFAYSDMNTAVTVTGQTTNTDISLVSTELVFKQQVRYRTRNQAQEDVVDIVSHPFWDDLANADLVEQLRLSGGVFTSLEGPIGVPEFVSGESQQGTREKPTLLLVLIISTSSVLIVGLIVYFLRRKGAVTAEKSNKSAGDDDCSDVGQDSVTSRPVMNQSSTTITTSTGYSSSGPSGGTSVLPLADVIGPRPSAQPEALVIGQREAAGLHRLMYKNQVHGQQQQSMPAAGVAPDVATVEAIPVSDQSMQL